MPSSFSSTTQGPSRSIASVTEREVWASMGWTGRPTVSRKEARAPGPSASSVRATGPSDPASMTARRTSSRGAPAASARASTATASSAPWRTSPVSSPRRKCCSCAVAAPSRRVRRSLRAACEPGPPRAPMALSSASVPATVSVGSPAGVTGTRRVLHPIPRRPCGRRPARYGITTGTSSGSASRKSAASRAVFRVRAEVAATSRDTRAILASSMRPSCYVGGLTAPRAARGPSDDVEGRCGAHSAEDHEGGHQHLDLDPAAGPEAHELRRAEGVPALAAHRYGPQDRAAGDRERVTDVVDEGSEDDGQPEPHVLLAGRVEQPARTVAGLVQHAREDPRAGRAEQPDQDVAGDAGRAPQQSLDREHEVDEEDGQDRPPAAGDRGHGAPGADQHGPEPGVGEGAVATGPARVPGSLGRLVDGVGELVDDFAECLGDGSEGTRDRGRLVVEVRGERRAGGDQGPDDQDGPGHRVARGG